MIYFISDSDELIVKIGKAKDVVKRMKGLQTANPKSLILLAVLKGYSEEETALHLKFIKYQEREEWFRLEGKLKELWKKSLEHNKI